MDDFETVRWGGLDSTKRAALNRIEAEAERLRDENQKLRDPYKVLAEREAEVERLRAIIIEASRAIGVPDDGADLVSAIESLRDEGFAEVERLRGALKDVENYSTEFRARNIARNALAKEES